MNYLTQKEIFEFCKGEISTLKGAMRPFLMELPPLDNTTQLVNMYTKLLEMNKSLPREKKWYWRAICQHSHAYIVDHKPAVFQFDDPDLVDAILGSKIGRIPAAAIKMPFENMIIHLPRNCQLTDCIVFSAVHIFFSEYPDKSKKRFNAVFYGYDDTDEITIQEVFFDYDETTIIEDHGGDDENKQMHTQIYQMVIKLLMFLTTAQAEVEVRESPLRKNKAHKLISTTVRHVKYKAPVINYKFTGEPGKWKQKVRSHVMGHFKHLSKSGKIVWWREHWRGPVLGIKTEKVYHVE